MVQLTPVLVASIVGLFAGSTAAHPGHDHTQEAAERAEFMKRGPRGLEHCAEKMKERGLDRKMMARREALASSLRAKRNLADRPFLKARDVDDVLNKDHHSNLTGIDLDTDPSEYFGDDTACILQPDVTEGPYYVNGELIRDDVVENEEGVDLTIDIQIIDTSTCEPLADIYTDFWHCNATGVYKGIVAEGNGDASDESNLNKTALRGLQKTDEEGVVRFDSIFPGHYTGRTPHIHVLTHNGGEVLPNNTLTGLGASHIGQIFFDQSLITEVETNAPYSTNTQPLTLNEEDMILAEEADTSDPVLEYVYLGESAGDGLLGWITIGIDPTAETEANPAVTWTENGGVENEDGGGGDFPPMA